MKNNLALTVLTVILAVSSLSAAALCWLFVTQAAELRGLQNHVNMINGRKTAANALIADTLRYSERNPAINPILQASGLKRAATNAPKPAATN